MLPFTLWHTEPKTRRVLVVSKWFTVTYRLNIKLLFSGYHHVSHDATQAGETRFPDMASPTEESVICDLQFVLKPWYQSTFQAVVMYLPGKYWVSQMNGIIEADKTFRQARVIGTVWSLWQPSPESNQVLTIYLDNFYLISRPCLNIIHRDIETCHGSGYCIQSTECQKCARITIHYHVFKCFGTLYL